MRACWVTVERDFAAPVEQVFAHLSEHENLSVLLGAKIERLNDGQPERNGVGSRRQLRIGPLAPFEETVTKYVPGELIEYRITKGTPLREHVGSCASRHSLAEERILTTGSGSPRAFPAWRRWSRRP